MVGTVPYAQRNATDLIQLPRQTHVTHPTKLGNSQLSPKQTKFSTHDVSLE